MFLHASILHWAANSWALYQLGTLYESMFGSARFALIYFVTGIIASIASSLAMPPQSPFEPLHCGVGASGAVLGILGAFIFSIKRSPVWRNEPWTRNLLSQLLFWAAVNLVLGTIIKNIDNVAHLGGMISGLLLGFLPHRVTPPPPSTTVVDVAAQ
jgi:rhomboid protease GluP